jgi:hypothetical protein
MIDQAMQKHAQYTIAIYSILAYVSSPSLAFIRVSGGQDSLTAGLIKYLQTKGRYCDGCLI